MDVNSSETAVKVIENHSNFTSLESLTNSTQPVNRSSNGIPPEYVVFYNLADDIYFYGLSVVIPFGLIGNFFSVCVFLLSSILRRTTTGQFLVALAIADSTLLVGDMMRWLAHQNTSKQHYVSTSLGLNIHDTSSAACKITHFLRYGGGLCSVWLTIAIAVERTLAVAFPLRISRISTLRRSRVAIFIITIISFSSVLSVFFHFEINKPPCSYKENKESYNKWNIVVIRFGALFIPCVLIFVLTIIINVLLCRARKKRISHLASNTQNGRQQYLKPKISTETQLTFMLVAVCVSTIALRAPYTIAHYFRSQCWPPNDCSPLKHMQTFVAYRVTEVFNILNHAIDFIMYCLCGSSFRRQIKMTVCHATSPENCVRYRPATPETL